MAEHWFELYVRGDAAAVRSLTAQIPPERVERDAEVSAALACAALDVADTDVAELHLAHAEQAAGRAVPAPRRYLQTMALANLGTSRLEGDFEAALNAADDLLAAGRARQRRRRRRAARRSCTRCSARPRSGATGSTAPARS